MKFFADTADTGEIRDLAATGLLDGVTTNPSLVARTGKDFFDVLEAICALVEGPVSAEVTATDAAGMVAQGRRLAGVADNVVVKVPLTWDGLKACKALSGEERPSGKSIGVNVTLCFAPVQALLAAKAGAAFVSPFVGRLDDVGHEGMGLIDDIRTVYDHYPDLATEILVASVRHPGHVAEAARIGADACTCPPDVIRKLADHPLTDKGLAAFLDDWRKTGRDVGDLLASS